MPRTVDAPGGLAEAGAVWHGVDLHVLALPSYEAVPCRAPWGMGQRPRGLWACVVAGVAHERGRARDVAERRCPWGEARWQGTRSPPAGGWCPGGRRWVGTCLAPSRRHAPSVLPRRIGTQRRGPLDTAGG